MTDYIKREDAVEALNRHKKTFSYGEDNSKERYAYMQHLADFKAIEDIPSADVVPKSLYKQTQWERDFAEKRADDMSKLIRNKDVVAVVRCKDCKYIKEEHFNIMPDGFSCELSGLMVEPEHYCSYGARANK